MFFGEAAQALNTTGATGLRVAVLTLCALGLNYTVTCEWGREEVGYERVAMDIGKWTIMHSPFCSPRL